MRPQRLQSLDDARRLTLAALAALALHAGLMVSLPATWWVLPDRQPLQFEVVLRPPEAVISAPPPAPPIPAAQSLETTSLVQPPLETTPAVQSLETALPAPATDNQTPPAPAAVDPKPVVQPAPPKPTPATQQPNPAKTAVPARPPSRKSSPPAKPAPPVEPKLAREPARNKPKSLRDSATEAPKPPAKPREVTRRSTPAMPSAARAEPPMAEKNDGAELSSASRQSAPRGNPAARTARGRLDSAALLGQIASLETETPQQTRAGGGRAKRVNPSDNQSQEGFYIGSWVRKVERIGEMNFPDVARRLNLQTGPTLEVAIRANGSLQHVRIVRSSGNAELDQAAQRIVRLGAPYAPFPPQLRQHYDVLYISRPWRFESSGRLRMR